MIQQAINLPKFTRTHFYGKIFVTALFCLMFSSEFVFAQQDKAEIEREIKLYQSIKWEKGPCTVSIGDVSDLKVPAGYQFTGSKGAAIWYELTQNPPSDTDGILTPVDLSDNWFLSFDFIKTGYVPDDEKDKLDAGAILLSIKANTELANVYRRKRGWPEMHVVGWIHPPSYDELTNNLTWAIRAKSSNGDTANYDIRLLGRGGVMRVKLATSPERMDTYVPTIKGLLSGFHFQSGQKYSEFHSGDKVAKYGLTGLIVGGGTAVAAKMGLLAKLAAFFAKMGKVIFVGLATLALGIWNWLTGKPSDKQGK